VGKPFFLKNNGMSHFFNALNFKINHLYNVIDLKTKWIIDTGASQHMTENLQIFDKPPTENGHFVTISSGEICKTKSTGKITLSKDLILQDVLYIPQFKVNLISVNKLTLGSNLKILFDDKNCYFQGSGSGKVIGKGRSQDELYIYSSNPPGYAYTSLDSKTWHNRLGHISNEKKLVMLVKNQQIECRIKSLLCNKNSVLDNCNKVFSNKDCDVCPLSKQNKLKYTKSTSISKNLFDLIHIDI